MAHDVIHIGFEEFLANPRQVFDQVRRGGRPVLVERDGETYRLERDASRDLWDDYDPDAARRGLRAAAGALDGVDIDALLADLRAQRGQNSHGRPA